MTKGQEYREQAAVHFRLRDECQIVEGRKLLQRVAESYLTLAEQEQWLEGEINPVGDARQPSPRRPSDPELIDA